MKPELRLCLRFAALAALATLCACGDAGKKNVQGTAGGQVLEGSVSDAMLPVDRVRSQPPLAPKSDGGEKTGKKPSGEGSGTKSSGSQRSSTDDAPAAQAAAAGEADQGPPAATQDEE